MKYSASTRGFYDVAVHGDAIPADAVDVSKEDHAALVGGQVQGMRIVPDANGFPVLAEWSPSPAELLARLKTDARQALLDSDKVAARCMKFGVDYPQAWRTRDVALVGIVNLPEETDPASVVWPDDVPYPAGTDWGA